MANSLKMPTLELDDRIAIVTGAGAGIGAAISSKLAAAGAEVYMVSRDLTQLQKTVDEIKSAGGNVHACPCDVTNSAAIRDLIGKLKKLDIVINNAGTNIPEPFLDVSEDHLDFMTNLNVRASFVVSQAGVLKMKEDPRRHERGGSIVNISSQMGHVGSPNRTVYCMNKHAIEGLTKAMAIELAPSGIRVNSVCPTFVDTPLIKKIVDTPEKHDFLVSKIPLGKMASIDDIADATLFLVSPSAQMITGHSLLVDGGWTAQ